MRASTSPEPGGGGSDSSRTPRTQLFSRLPSSLSQFEEAIGHWRGRRGGDGQPLVDCLQDEAAGETPNESAGGARGEFWRDNAVGGPEGVFFVWEDGVCPPGSGVARRGAARGPDV